MANTHNEPHLRPVNSAVARSHAELHDAATSDAKRRRNVYLATVAHEVRNALAPLANVIDILEAEAPGPDEVAKLLPIARRQVRQLAVLANDLMDTGRAMNDPFQVTLAPECVQELVDDGIDAWRVLAASKRQAISVDMPGDALYVRADRIRIGQVLQNIIGNAVKFTPADGRISVRVLAGAGVARICITDTGIGISRADAQKVFALFYRVRGNGAQGGCGIGLSLARYFVELHGGTISAHSDGPGTGATFTISLPLAPAPAGA